MTLFPLRLGNKGLEYYKLQTTECKWNNSLFVNYKVKLNVWIYSLFVHQESKSPGKFAYCLGIDTGCPLDVVGMTNVGFSPLFTKTNFIFVRYMYNKLIFYFKIIQFCFCMGLDVMFYLWTVEIKWTVICFVTLCGY